VIFCTELGAGEPTNLTGAKVQGFLGKAQCESSPLAKALQNQLACLGFGWHQVEITERVPPVAGFESGGVGVCNDTVACDGVEHCEVGGVGLVPSRDQTIDDVHAAVWRDHEVHLTAARLCFAIDRRRLERSDHCGSQSYDAASGRPCGVDEPGGVLCGSGSAGPQETKPKASPFQNSVGDLSPTEI